MHHPGHSTQRSHVLALLKQRGMTRLAEFGAAGITASTISRMEQSGELVRLADQMPPKVWIANGRQDGRPAVS